MKKDIYSGLCIIVLGLLIYFWLIPLGVTVPPRVPNPALSPALWPKVIALLLFSFGLLLTIESLAQRKKQPLSANTEAADDNDTMVVAPGMVWRSATALGLLIPYYLAAVYLGLLLPSIAAFIAYSLLAGEKKILLPLIWGVIIPVSVTIFFIKAANILIPLGPLDHLF